MLLALFAWTTLVSAQITRKQADEIVFAYLQKEMIQPSYIYVNGKAISEGGIAITTTNEETVKVKYACWTYYLNEINDRYPQSRRYLFVEEDTGSLLAVITNYDAPVNLHLWGERVEMPTGLNDLKGDTDKFLYPNPVDDWLTLPCKGENTRVEIYDLKGTRLFSGSLSGNDACQLNVSFLSTGVYMVNVDGKTYKIIKN